MMDQVAQVAEHRARAVSGLEQTPEENEDAEGESGVADPVDDERLVAGRGVGMLFVPEPDQAVRTQSHAFPAHEHQQEVVGQHERQHGRGEQVQIREKAPVRLVVVHVAGRIEVNQPADAGHDEHHHARQWIDDERDVHAERADVNPAQ